MKHYYKLIIEYDGTNYVGWQRQKNGISVQEVLEAALAKLFKEKVSVVAASRTDSGVHALGQVASFYTTFVIPSQGLLRGLNSILPNDILIRQVRQMRRKFHATREAKGKIYRYLILNDELCSALFQKRTWFLSEHLNLAALKQAAKYFIGKHDFTSFMGRGASVKDAMRTIDTISITTTRKDFFGIGKVSLKGRYIVLTFQGKGFVKNQIRNMVGVLVEVGQGKRKASDMPKILHAKNRKAAGRMAPAQGLYLVKVIY